MPLVVWSASLHLGIQNIDAQHAQLVQYINDLHDAVKKGQEKEILSPLFEKLRLYAEEHFALEEDYFERYAFPDSALHIEEHRFFSKKLDELQAHAEQKGEEAFLPLMKFLSDWLINHIQETDMALAVYLKEKGILQNEAPAL